MWDTFRTDSLHHGNWGGGGAAGGQTRGRKGGRTPHFGKSQVAIVFLRNTGNDPH